MSKAVKAKKVRSNKPAKTVHTLPDIVTMASEAAGGNIREAYVKRIAQAIDEHGLCNFVFFTLTDEEVTSLELAARYDDEKNIHAWAKGSMQSMVRCNLESMAERLTKGEVKLVNGKAKR